ncbi:MAG: DUF4197 domain-containing protein [Gammaproteobacteria bacterium HGW-Gammaproteobacteria-1]|jgi:hypothetical protein|nr:MAG: DUF4197 domain-containing protein [Gammaproteobacteria bacterium HGW-Gammaproteobacteria-1]
MRNALKGGGLALVVVVMLLATTGCTNRDDWSRRVSDAAAGLAGQGQLGEADIVAGLKEALQVGTQRAVRLLGRNGGYLNDVQVRIPVPKSLQGMEKTLRDLGQGKAVDDFIASLNRAAERAAPEAVDIFVQVIRSMTLEDARNILNGPDDAATRFFRQRSETALTGKLRPVIAQATARVGVTSSYKDMLRRAGPLASLAGKDAQDLDGYVTARALDGLFLKLAAEEKLIRENPAARTTELLRKVFGGKG